MRIDDLLKKINLYDGHRDYFMFETFILSLLKVHMKKTKKPFYSQTRTFGFDGYAPEGIESVKGGTQVEVKLNLERFPTNRLIEQIKHAQARVTDKEPFENLIFLTPNNVSNKYLAHLTSLFQEEGLLFNIIVWGPKDVDELISKNEEEAYEISNNLFSIRIESAVSESGQDWQKIREERIDELQRSYENGQFSLFLGAGVSSSAGMPDWNTLLNSLFVTYLTKELDSDKSIPVNDVDEIVTRLNEIDEPSALMAARYLRKGLNNLNTGSRNFTQEISQNLYGLRDENKNENSELIKAITELCMPERTGAKVKSVVTYNFDDLIEKQLNNLKIQHHSIYTDNEYYDPNELPIYHVHGFLPRNTSNYESLEKSTLVFSEEGYHLIYSEAYHWSNLIQLSNLKHNHCLMVGLSMTDPNLRRLLDISSRNTEQPRHFAFLKRLTNKEFIKEKSKTVIRNSDAASNFLKRHHNLNEEIMRELGVSTIWYTNYDEIPEILRQIRQSSF